MPKRILMCTDLSVLVANAYRDVVEQTKTQALQQDTMAAL